MKIFGIILMFVFLEFIICIEKSLACHEGAMGGQQGIGPTLRGHNPTTRANGLLVFTESTTAASSTTTSCDEYTGFLEKSYDQIAENAARGEGIFIDALSIFYGCPLESKDRFQKIIKENFNVLFKNHKKNGFTLGNRLVIVLKSNKTLSSQCSHLNKIT